MNAPERFELFVLPEGVKKVSIAKDTKILNTATFTVQLEDHTLGNMLSSIIRKDPEVVFCGYKVPHPLEHHFVLRIQTTSKSSPSDAFKSGLDSLLGQFSILKDAFSSECRNYESSRIGRGYM